MASHVSTRTAHFVITFLIWIIVLAGVLFFTWFFDFPPTRWNVFTMGVVGFIAGARYDKGWD
jgi:hypothetical protein